MNREHFARMRTQPIYRPAVAFILALRAEGLPLRAFVTSDWNSAPSYVYVDLRGEKLADGRRSWRENMARRCVRLDRYGIAAALRRYLRNVGPSSCHL